MRDDDLTIPEFLRRLPCARSQHDPLPPAAAQPEEQRSAWVRIDERKRQKSRGRVAKMKAKMADREAMRAGKVWDTVTGRWR